MARITWNNVAAPDFRGSVQAQELAANLIGKAVDSFSKGFTGIGDNRDERDAARALEKMQGINSVSGWDQFMKKGGLSQLGISADRATPQLSQFMVGQRGNLSAQEQAAYTLARSREEDARADAARLLKSEALALANEASNLSGVYKKEDAERWLWNKTADNPQLRAAALEAFGNSSDIPFTLSDSVTYTPEGQALIDDLSAQLDEKESELNIQEGANIPLRVLSLAERRAEDYGTNPVSALAERMTSQTQYDDDGEKTKAFDENMGSLSEQFKQLQRYDLPPEVIAAVMENHLEGNGWVFSGDKAIVDDDAVKNILDKLSKPEDRNSLRTQARNLNRERLKYERARKTLTQKGEQLRFAIQRGETGNANRLRNEIRAIQEGLAPPQPKSEAEVIGGGTGTENPEGISETTEGGGSGEPKIPSWGDDNPTPEEEIARMQATISGIGDAALGALDWAGGKGQGLIERAMGAGARFSGAVLNEPDIVHMGQQLSRQGRTRQLNGWSSVNQVGNPVETVQEAVDNPDGAIETVQNALREIDSSRDNRLPLKLGIALSSISQANKLASDGTDPETILSPAKYAEMENIVREAAAQLQASNRFRGSPAHQLLENYKVWLGTYERDDNPNWNIPRVPQQSAPEQVGGGLNWNNVDNATLTNRLVRPSPLPELPNWNR